MSSPDCVKEAMEKLLLIFEDDNLEKVAHAVFKGSGDQPSDKWSFLNRVLMFLNDSDDARGFKQWQHVGRNVKKGSKAFYIIGPRFKKLKDEKTQEEKEFLTGFMGIPVFRYGDTEGEPITRSEFKLDIPYEFTGIIQELGLKVQPARFNGSSYGSYNLVSKNIKLASPDIEIFLHELSHAVDDKITGLKLGQRNDQEVTAEFSAAVIAHLMGYKIALGNVKAYIESYSFKELMSCLSRIEKIVSFIIERTRAAVSIQVSDTRALMVIS